MLEEVHDSLSSELGDGTIYEDPASAIVRVNGAFIEGRPGTYISTVFHEELGLELAVMFGKALPAGNPRVDSAASEAVNRIRAKVPTNGGSKDRHGVCGTVFIRRGKHANRRIDRAAT